MAPLQPSPSSRAWSGTRCACTGDTAAYLKQCRQHVIERLLDRIYVEGGTPNKHWMMFAKYKFMGKVLRN